MHPHLPSKMAAYAANNDLGELQVVYRDRRSLSLRMVWALTGVAAAVALVGAVAHLVVLALLPIGLTAIAIGVYTLLPPRRGYRWIACYDNALVDALPGKPWRAVRWEEISTIESRAGSAVLLLHQGEDGAAESIPLDGVADQTELATHIHNQLSRRRSWTALHTLKQRAAARRRDNRGTLVALIVLALVPVMLYPVYAADAPPSATVAPATTGSTVSAPVATVSGSIGPSPSAAEPSASPSVDTADLSGYGRVCTGAADPGAAAYGGPGRHPVVFFGVGSEGREDIGSSGSPPEFDDTLDPWTPANVTQVQLVACISASNGRVIRDCGEYGPLNPIRVTLVHGLYTITLYEARTARQVAGPIRLSGTEDTRCPVNVTSTGAATKTVRDGLSNSQLRRALQQYIG
jgi:hypothetical protein